MSDCTVPMKIFDEPLGNDKNGHYIFKGSKVRNIFGDIGIVESAKRYAFGTGNSSNLVKFTCGRTTYHAPDNQLVVIDNE